MAKRRNVPQPQRPRLRVSAWRALGEKYYTPSGTREDGWNAKGVRKRQALRVEPYYHRPPRKQRSRKATRPPRDRAKLRALRAEQAELLEGLQATNSAATGRDSTGFVFGRTERAISPVRERQLRAGFAAAGMSHLID